MESSAELFFFLDLVAFLAAIFMHLVKKNTNLIRLYAMQSLAVSVLLLSVGLGENEQSLVWVALLTFAIKVVAAPAFFFRLMRRFGSQFTASNYLNTPLTLLTLSGLIILAYSRIFLPLGILVPQAVGYLSLALSIVFVSIFLMINRRGAFAQMVGILSLENGIVVLAALIGIKQPIALEIGIIFDIVIWMVIANVFIAMIYRQFGSLTVTDLKRLTED